MIQLRSFVILSGLLISLPFISCSTIQTAQQKTQLYSTTSDTLTLPKSKERIDKTPTYELFFELLDNTRCLDISVIAQDRNGKRFRCAFILEALVDTSLYPVKPLKPIYTEFARNFDINWRFQSNIFICSDENDPLKRLTKGNYRLKISAFSNNYYTFTIDIKSSVPVEFRK